MFSTYAVQIKVGAPVRIDGWGGQLIKGRVVRGVDPAGVLKRLPASISHRNNRMAEVPSGLAAGERVVLQHPSDRITDGSRIAPGD